MYWADELASRVSGPQVVNDSKTPSGTVHVGQPARAGHPRRHRPRPARQRSRDDVPVRRRRPRPDGLPGAPDARRDRPRHGRAAGPRPGPAGDCHAELCPPFRGELFMDVSRDSASIPIALLDERALPDRGDGSVHPPGTRPGRRWSARSTGVWPTSSTRTTGIRSGSSARTAARSGRPSSPTGTATRSPTSAGRTS